MKKFIKALENKGIMKSIVDSAIRGEKFIGSPMEQGALEMILEFEMSNDEDLEDIFLQEAHAIAMNSVFKYVQKQIEEKKKTDDVEDNNEDDSVGKLICALLLKELLMK